MKPKLKIHFWEIRGYVNINSKMKHLIFEKIKKRSSVNKFSKRIGMTSVSLNNFLQKGESFVRIINLLKIVSELEISRKELEKEIIGYKDTSSKDSFNIKFPYILSPLDLRIIGSLIGDGNVHKENNLLRWIQKDTTPMKELIEYRLNKKIYSEKREKEIIIPSFFGKIFCCLFELSFEDLDTEKLIGKSLDLPKDYILTLLIALIEDEGNIDVKNYGGVNIRMDSKKIILDVKEVCKILDYKTSKIVCYQNNGNFGKGNNVMYKIKINAEGIRKMGYDVIRLENDFGKVISFWKKREAFFQRWEKTIGNKSMADFHGKKIRESIEKLFLENKKISPLQISREIGENYDRVYDIIKNMYKRGKLEKVGRGIYIKRKRKNLTT